jgi:hypothetical protein
MAGPTENGTTMAGCRANLIGLMLLIATGCGHLEVLRQGAQSTYHKELKQLAADIDRKELAKITAVKEEHAAAAEESQADSGTAQRALQWHAAPLIDAVQLQPPVPLNSPIGLADR